MHAWAFRLFQKQRKIWMKKFLLYTIFHNTCEFRQRLLILSETATFRKLSHMIYFKLHFIFSVETYFYNLDCLNPWLQTYSENPQVHACSCFVRSHFIFYQLLLSTYNATLPDNPFQLLIKAWTGYLKSVIDIILGVPLLVSRQHHTHPKTSVLHYPFSCMRYLLANSSINHEDVLEKEAEILFG